MRLLFLLLCIQSLQADPYRFMRLIKGDKHIEKTVDLIFEKHKDILSPAKKGSRRSKKLLTPQELKQYSPSVRALISSLRILGNKKRPIALLWEIDKESLKNNPAPDPAFIISGAVLFHEEFNTKKNKNISFISADNYRHSIEINPTGKEAPVTVGQFLPLLNRLLSTQESPIEHDLKQTQDQVDQKAKNALNQLWENGKKRINEIITVLKKYDPNASVEKTISSLSREQQGLIEQTIIRQLPDLELIFKLFAAPEKHIIIYAGGGHCQIIAQRLIKLFKFKTAIDVGIEKPIKNLLIPLDPNAFNYIVIDPQQSWKGISQEKNLPKQKSFTHTFTRENIDAILNNKKSIETTIKEYRKILVDIPNSYVTDQQSTLLRYALVHDFFDAAEILIQNGAKAISNDLIIVIRKNKPKLARLLLKHGAQPNDGTYKYAQSKGGEIATLFSDYRTSKTIPVPPDTNDDNDLLSDEQENPDS